jgi:hypothetical protein
LLDALELYKTENEDKDFTVIHCLKKLKGFKKWDRFKRTLNDGKTGGEEGPLPSTAASVGRLVGNKKTKAERM